MTLSEIDFYGPPKEHSNYSHAFVVFFICILQIWKAIRNHIFCRGPTCDGLETNWRQLRVVIKERIFFGEGEIRRTWEEKVKIHSKKKTKEKKFQDQWREPDLTVVCIYQCIFLLYIAIGRYIYIYINIYQYILMYTAV